LRRGEEGAAVLVMVVARRDVLLSWCQRTAPASRRLPLFPGVRGGRECWRSRIAPASTASSAHLASSPVCSLPSGRPLRWEGEGWRWVVFPFERRQFDSRVASLRRSVAASCHHAGLQGSRDTPPLLGSVRRLPPARRRQVVCPRLPAAG
jgi:hypothetical protein